MKKKSLIKDMFRDIKGSFGRFISIVAIIALGVAFFSGLKIAPEDMKLTADKYYDDYDLMDLRVVSNLGLTEDDVKEISKLKGVKEVKGAYTIDALAEDDEKEVVLRIHDFEDENQINSAKLLKGRFPQKIDECVIEVENENILNVEIGEKIKLSSGKKEDLEDDLKNTEFTVVGFIQSPYYLSFEKGSTNIGSGQLRDFIMIPKENFKMDVFTDIFVDIDGVVDLNSYDDEYFDQVKPIENRIKDIAGDREKARYEDIYDEAKEEIDDGREEYEEEKLKAEEELDKALKEIEDGKLEIEKGEKELRENEDLFYSEINKGEKEIGKAEKKLNEGQAEYNKGLKEFNKQKKNAEIEFKKADDDLKRAEDGIAILKENISKIESFIKNPQIPQYEKAKLEVQLKELKSILSTAKPQYQKGKAEYEKSLKEFNKGINEGEEKLDKAKLQLDKAKVGISTLETNIKKIEQALEKPELPQEEKIKLEKQLQELKATLKKTKAQYESGIIGYEKNLKEFNDKKEQGQKQLEVAKQELVDAKLEIETLKDTIGNIQKALENPELSEEERNKLQAQLEQLNIMLSKSESDYEAGMKEYEKSLNKFNKEIEEAKIKLETAKEELDRAKDGISVLETNISKIEQALENPELPEEEKKKLEAQLQELNVMLAQTKMQYEAGMKEYNKNLKEFNEKKEQGKNELSKAKQELAKAEEGISTLESNINKIEEAIKNPQIPEEEKQKLDAQLKELKTTLSTTQTQYKNGKKELAKGREELIQGAKKLQDSKIQLDESRVLLETESAKLDEEEAKGKIEIQNAKNDLTQARIDLEEGETEYNQEKEKAEKELDKALKDIEKGERKLKRLEKAEWHVLNRKKHYSYVDYGQSADRIDALSTVFPLFFALVAALVSLTTMTRMVDEQRINIGTLKALGYGKGSIAFKYIFYAFSATLVGAILGIAIGYTVFPIIIFNAYGLMYQMPKVILSFNFKLAALVSLFAIALTTLTAFLASSNELRDNPASLMRPKAPRLGKTILIEKVPFIWNRFNFNYKVTIRNLFRYKRRFFMTVFGIAGCTALILAGFGIRDSIQTVIDKQFNEILAYDMEVSLQPEGVKYLDDEESIENYKLVLSEGGKASFKDVEKDISIIVPEDTKEFNEFIYLQNRKSGKYIELNNGLVITEGMSRALNLKKGDTIELTNSYDEKAEIIVDDIAENYTFNYIYMTSQKYEEVFDEPIEYNGAFTILNDKSKDNEEIIAKSLTDNEEINNVNFTSTSRDDLEDTIKSLNYVVILMTVTAGALAFVVLYNLTNINISERIREIATIKVLGFYDNEVSAYIYRENTILTIIGTITGLGIGIFLHRFIIETVEMESLMLGLKLDRNSFIYASVLTILFAVIVNVVMHFKLKQVEMVESLKSVD